MVIMAVNLTDEILRSVEKPSRYTGNEFNSVIKDAGRVDIRFAFCFPDTYEVGMSHLGMKILYHLLNERDDTYCERVFAPWVDMEEKMRQNNIPLYALESKDAIKDFDFVGFTLQYEMSYTNIINMLDLAGIPVLSEKRTEEHPFICAGGPCAYNPEPLAEIVDFFMLGEGEEIINEVMDCYKVWKKDNLLKEDFLKRIVKIEGIYVPSFYDVQYNDDGLIKSIEPKDLSYPKKIRKRIIKDLNGSYYPDKIIVPFTEIIHDRIMLELFRGCIRGCRFCQAGYVYRPVREKTAERLLALAEKLERNTGYEEMSLTSLSTSDYTEFNELSSELIDRFSDKRINISLPSLRIDTISLELMEKLQKVRKSGLTLAPEAGTQRLRNVINKGVTETDLFNSVTLAFNSGWSSVKLYFMIGLPTETFDDLNEIANLCGSVVGIYAKIPRDKRGKSLSISVSASSFVPKPFTPFQWEAQDTMDLINEKQIFLRSRIKNKSISFHYNDKELSFLEAVLARGDRRIGKVLINAVRHGCRFDSWGEHFKYSKWIEAFNETGIDPSFYANRKREFNEILPWDHIDIGVSKEFLISEAERAYKEETTSNCRVECNNCGATVFGGGICVE
jgi:radical SAM family uncharacterized protein